MSSATNNRMSLESSVLFWDAISFWFITGGVILAFVGGVASIMFRRYNRQLVAVTEVQNREEKAANEKAIAEANARAADANKIAEQERLARLQLEARLAPRSLSSEQAADLTSKLREFSGTKIDICEYPNDFEVARLTNPIVESLKAAGWTVNGFRPLAPTIRIFSGLAVLLDESKVTEREKHAAQKLTDALQSEGLFTWGPAPLLPTDALGMSQGQPMYSFRLIVGSKP